MDAASHKFTFLGSSCALEIPWQSAHFSLDRLHTGSLWRIAITITQKRGNLSPNHLTETLECQIWLRFAQITGFRCASSDVQIRYFLCLHPLISVTIVCFAPTASASRRELVTQQTWGQDRSWNSWMKLKVWYTGRQTLDKSPCSTDFRIVLYHKLLYTNL